MYYKQLGIKNAFKLWWSFLLIFKCYIYFFSNLFILWDSTNNLSDFQSVNLKVLKFI